MFQGSGCLIGEGLEELGAGGSEEVVLIAVQNENAERLVPADQWKCSCALDAQAGQDVAADERRVGRNVVHPDGESRPDCPNPWALAGKPLIPARGEVSSVTIFIRP